MQGTSRVLRIVMVSILASLTVATAMFGPARDAVAYWPFDYLDGLDQTITRHYSRSTGDEKIVVVEIDATIARFSGEDAARAGYDEVAGAYAAGFAGNDPEAPPAASDDSDGELDFAALEGGQRAVSRVYSGDMSALQDLATAPAGIYNLVAFAAEFDTDAHAAAALDTIYADFVANLAQDDTITLGEVDPGEVGDQAVAGFGSAEQDGVPVELSLVVARDGAWLYMATALGVGEGAGSLDAAGGLARAMIDADAGEGDGTFDESGGSTGGIWDTLPAEGDPALLGLTPDTDIVIYPEPEGAS